MTLGSEKSAQLPHQPIGASPHQKRVFCTIQHMDIKKQVKLTVKKLL